VHSISLPVAARGATEAASVFELALASDVVFACLPSIEVEATVFGDAGSSAKCGPA
jgi:3-hydroxyisobutyrate dehydrogenase-like beta-hydroxyacid dehydrogenase